MKISLRTQKVSFKIKGTMCWFGNNDINTQMFVKR